MGTGGHDASPTGLDYAVVQANRQRWGQIVQLDVRALWLSPGNNVRVTVDDGEETVLRGTDLPPVMSGARRFRSKPGGKIQVLLVTDKSGSLAFVSLAMSDVYDCNIKPPSTNGHFAHGCPGAVWQDGNASWDYCKGYHPVSDNNRTLELWYPWRAACCRWMDQTETCEPVCTRLNARVKNECCAETLAHCVCQRKNNVTCFET
eukprot:COSAG02_NODE_9176_length_2301_cov_4.578111_2_plen_204_part_00